MDPPSVDEIRRACDEIRRDWSAETELLRRHGITSVPNGEIIEVVRQLEEEIGLRPHEVIFDRRFPAEFHDIAYHGGQFMDGEF